MELVDISEVIIEDAVVDRLQKADAEKRAKSLQNGGRVEAKPDLKTNPKPSQQEKLLIMTL